MTTANLFGALEGPELLIILALVLLLFGGSKLPELAKSLGKAKREFHDAMNDPQPTDTAVAVTTDRADETR